MNAGLSRAGKQGAPPLASAEARKADRRYQGIDRLVLDQNQQCFGRGVRCQALGGEKPVPDAGEGNCKADGIGRHAGYVGSSMTTAVQLWKPPNCPSARAICP